MTQLSPIILFAYKRPYELKKVLEALEKNFLALESELYIFVDGPKIKEDNFKVEAVRKLCDEIKGFKKITRIYHETNQGCANSIINGISIVLKTHSSAIIIEDDIVTSKNFLVYMNECLDFYESNKAVFSISGYCLNIFPRKEYLFDSFAFTRSGSWGWATWADRWFSVDWEVSDYKEFSSDRKSKRAFNLGGSDLVKMLNDYMRGKIDAWDIRFTYHQFKQGGLTIYPIVSKAENIGFYGSDATHTQVFNRYKVALDNSEKKEFVLPSDLTLDKTIIKQFQQYYSIPTRIIYRVKTILGMRE